MLVSLVLLAAILPLMVKSQCTVSLFDVQQDFDVAKFQGRWFIQKKFSQFRLPQDSYSNREHVYTKGAGNDLDVLSFGRSPSGSCQYEHGEMKRPFLTGSNAAKLRYQPSLLSRLTVNYWVVDTDYESYALIYGCNRILLKTGRCLSAYSLVLERTRKPSRSEEIRQKIDGRIVGLCLRPNRFQIVSQTGKRCRQCERSMWTVQPNFDLDRYLGAWYEIVFKPRMFFPPEFIFNDYLHIYSQLPNGTVSVRLIGRRPMGKKECFLLDGEQSMEKTVVDGKLLFFDSPDRSVHKGDDYWVIETDYTGYALVLGCVREPSTPDGACEGFRMWVWSRKPYLTSTQFVRIAELFDQFCIDKHDLFITTQDSICPREASEKEKVEVCVLYDKPDVCIRGL